MCVSRKAVVCEYAASSLFSFDIVHLGFHCLLDCYGAIILMVKTFPILLKL